MSALSRLEALLERLMEGGFARLARAKLQPVEIAKQAAREMERHRTAGVNRVLVPNYYEIWLHPDDFAPFAAIASTLQAEIATYLQEYAAQRGFSMPGSPVVALGEHPDARPRQIHVQAHLEDPMAVEVEQREPGIQATSVMPAVAPAAAPVETTYLAASDGKRHDLQPGTVTVGRALENTIALEDKRVSRYHAQARYAGGYWTLSDVGATNGTFVNGKQIKQTTLRHGDTISFGGVELTFHQTWG